MSIITPDTLYRDIRVGDLFPSGHYVVATVQRPTLDPTRFTVHVTTCYFVKSNGRAFVPADKGDPDSQPRICAFAPEWADETLGQVYDRARYFAEMAN